MSGCCSAEVVVVGWGWGQKVGMDVREDEEEELG